MQLESITYAQFEGKPEEWRIKDFSFGNINLIVGKNATGKSRTLRIIKGLGDLVSGDHKLDYKSGNYTVTFKNLDQEIKYFLEYKESEVIKEKLIMGSDVRLDRGPKGKGDIYYAAADINGFVKFQSPPGELACVNRRDNVQHPFFEGLYSWGKNLRYYCFGTPLGQNSVSKKDKGEELDLKNTAQTVAILKKGIGEYPNNFLNSVRADMANIGYNIDDIFLGLPKSIIMLEDAFEQAQCIIVKEKDLDGETDQFAMSQGMFRALSLIIQLNYSLLASIPSCILIDDIGEGLDYERSSALINLLIDKAKNSHVQLIMSTNDRFVMNNVPLEYWSIMQRFSDRSEIYNYRNSKKIFEDFELTGLSNFDFFTSGSFEER